MPVCLYLDTSAVLKVYRREPGSDRVDALLGAAGPALRTSRWPLVETASALGLHVRQGLLSVSDAAALSDQVEADLVPPVWELQDATPAVFARARQLVLAHVTAGLRGPYAVHIATAQQLEEPLFVTADVKQAAAARLVGLKVALISG